MMLKPLQGCFYILYCIYIHCTPNLNIHYIHLCGIFVGANVCISPATFAFFPALRHSVVEMIEDTSEFVKHLCCRHVFLVQGISQLACRKGGETVSRFRPTCKSPRMLVHHHQDDMNYFLGGFGLSSCKKVLQIHPTVEVNCLSIHTLLL